MTILDPPKLNNLRDQVPGVWKTQEKIENFLDSAQGTAGRPESSQKKTPGRYRKI